MNDQYLIVSRKILPEFYQSVVDARNMIQNGSAKSVSEAVKAVGISRSTYYKFKDYIFSPSENSMGKKAVISMLLDHEKGVLSEVLNLLATVKANILTINQSIPVSNKASVTIALDMSDATATMDVAIHQLSQLAGVNIVRLVALE